MRETSVNAPSDLLSAAQAIMRWSKRLLDKAPLNDQQRDDMQLINEASTKFYHLARAEMVVIHRREDPNKLQQVRHQLRNHINIVVGFAGIMIKEMPDNLIMNMVDIRRINEAGNDLLVYVDEELR